MTKERNPESLSHTWLIRIVLWPQNLSVAVCSYCSLSKCCLWHTLGPVLLCGYRCSSWNCCNSMVTLCLVSAAEKARFADELQQQRANLQRAEQSRDRTEAERWIEPFKFAAQFFFDMPKEITISLISLEPMLLCYQSFKLERLRVECLLGLSTSALLAWLLFSVNRKRSDGEGRLSELSLNASLLNPAPCSPYIISVAWSPRS